MAVRKRPPESESIGKEGVLILSAGRLRRIPSQVATNLKSTQDSFGAAQYQQDRAKNSYR